MDWQSFVDEGLVRETEIGGREPAMKIIRRAWERVIAAREAYLGNDWATADTELRDAFVVATEALLLHSSLKPAVTCDYAFALQAGVQAFGEHLAEPIFEKAEILRGLMPLEPEIDKETARLVRRSVAASSEYVALVESFVFL